MKRTQRNVLTLLSQWMGAIVLTVGFLPILAHAQTASGEPAGDGKAAHIDLSRMGKAELLRNMDEVRRQNPYLYERLRRMPKDADGAPESSNSSTDTKYSQPAP